MIANPFLKGLAFSLALALVGCGGTEVTRVGADEQVDLTDRWNMTDSRNTAEVMIEDMLSFPWIDRFQQANSDRDRPRVIVQSIRNRSHEHIPVDAFINELRREMIRSGRVDFVAGSDEREELRDERRDQEFHADPDAMAEMGRELGADFALIGSIDSTVDRLEGTRVTSYQVDMRLVNIETNVDVWHGQHQEQKVMERSSRAF